MQQKLNSILFIFVLFFVLTFTVHAQNNLIDNYVPPVQKQITYNGISIIKNIRYGSIPEFINDSVSDRILDLYLPNKVNEKESLPVFLYLHGGGFVNGDKGMLELCSKISLQGFAVVSINYRLTLRYKKVIGASCSSNMAKGLPPNGSFHPILNEAIKNASDDAISAMQWIKNHAAKYKLNINKVAITGSSAGAMAALYVAYGSKQKVLPIKGVVNFYGGLENVNVITKGAPPVLIYHGDLDKTINIAYAHAIKDRMDVIESKKSQLHVLKDKPHSNYKLIVDEKIDEIVSFLNKVI
ncbi:alpha/beta hydrolase [Pedobacter glucosidilyticus]|uniref:alpha/beta hydrolase n=1 Tax=Pedobacter glucosidilyticus TaxID=1122941 RepID=UPI00047EC38E|nr:alpha/beta hydrolase [Pedobacter glucosidilyticus]